MVEIKATYHDEFKETLVDEIKKRYSDDQMNLLLALIKGKIKLLFIPYKSRVWLY